MFSLRAPLWTLPLLLVAAVGCGRGSGPDYEAAVWLQSQRGQMEVVDAAGTALLVNPSDSLPGGNFTIRKIAWDIYPGDQNAAIGDAELSHVATLAKLEDLDLWTSAVSDAGLAQLATLSSLKQLNLSETQVTDAGLVHLKSLAHLERLHLSGTQVSDSCITQLAQMKQLKHIDVTRTQVTKAGAQQLKRALPGCVVMHAVEAPAGS